MESNYLARVTLATNEYMHIGGDLYYNLGDSPFPSNRFYFSSLGANTKLSFINCTNTDSLELYLGPEQEQEQEQPETPSRLSLNIDRLPSLGLFQAGGIKFSSINITAAALRTIPDTIFPQDMVNIKLASLDQLDDLSIPAVQEVTADISLVEISSAIIGFPELWTIGGNFELINSGTRVLSLPALRGMEGDMLISNGSKLQGISVPIIVYIRTLSITQNPVLESLDFAKLAEVGSILIEENKNLTVMDLKSWFPALVQVNGEIKLVGQFSE